VESKESTGSTFWLSFIGKANTLREMDREIYPDIAGTRILVVDDNATNRKVLTGMLKSWNCYSDEAIDAPLAMEKLKTAASKGILFVSFCWTCSCPGWTGKPRVEESKMTGAEIPCW